MNKLKKDSFLQGALVATLSIILSKFLGIIYVIPFNRIVGPLGGALYGYAYSIYQIFINLSTIGIPFAMCKLISEYHEKGYYKSVEKSIRIVSKIMFLIGFGSFLILILVAPYIAYFIAGSGKGGNTVGDITLVIRVISFTMILTPMLSVYRGYFQGQNYIKVTSVSNLLEQIVRVSIIIFVSMLFLVTTSEKSSYITKVVVSIALISSAIGGIFSLIYLKRKHKELSSNIEHKSNEKIRGEEIIKTVLIYAMPFVLLTIFRTIYNSIDVFWIVRSLSEHFDFTKESAETVSSVISTWGSKLNMIVIAISTGIMTSLVPNISAALTNKDYKSINRQINLSLRLLCFFSVPMAFALSFMTKEVWVMFYSHNSLSIIVYQFFVFTTIFNVLFTTTTVILQTLGHGKTIIYMMIASFLTKLILHYPLMYLFKILKLPVFYGAILATLLGYIVSTIICLLEFKKVYGTKYRKTIVIGIIIMIITSIMIFNMWIVSIILPTLKLTKVTSIIYILIYTFIGGITFLLLGELTGIIRSIVGKDKYLEIKNKLIRKFKRQ